MANYGQVREGDVFDQWWDYLSDMGECDARGGAEYTRVRAEWDEHVGTLSPAARRVGIVQFIRRRANVGPGGA